MHGCFCKRSRHPGGSSLAPINGNIRISSHVGSSIVYLAVQNMVYFPSENERIMALSQNGGNYKGTHLGHHINYTIRKGHVPLLLWRHLCLRAYYNRCTFGVTFGAFLWVWEQLACQFLIYFYFINLLLICHKIKEYLLK